MTAASSVTPDDVLFFAVLAASLVMLAVLIAELLRHS